jgi:hypothetical protein
MAWLEYVDHDRVDPAHQVADRDHIIQIHGVCAITAFFAFANRVADGLGVELEDGRG